MRLIEDSPTRRVFEERGDEAKYCMPKDTTGTGFMDYTPHVIVLFLASIALNVFCMASQYLYTIEQGNSHIDAVRGLILMTLICIACLSGAIIYTWRYVTQDKRRVIHYEFDLTANTFTLKENGRSYREPISATEAQAFVVEYHDPCYRVILISMSYGFYGRAVSPPPEFLASLKAIGLKEVDKLKMWDT